MHTAPERTSMNFGRDSVKNKIRSLKTTSSKASTKVKVSALRIFLLIILLLLVLGLCSAVGMIRGLIDSSPSLDTINVVPDSFATHFYYSDGTLSQTLITAGGNREYVTIDQIPTDVQNAFIAIEDERFREHYGIDVRSIFRSVVELLSSGRMQSGASTITQQLLKNQVFGGGSEKSQIKKAIRKIQEQYLAIELENTLSKDIILEYYLNTINLGSGAYGIKKACQIYFGKSVSELTISEAAVLACIPKSPVYQNPVTHEENNRKRRLEVLKKMLNQGFIDEAQFAEAVSDTDSVYERINSVVTESHEISIFSYFTDEVVDQLMTDLQEKYGYSASEASTLIYSGGLEVHTTQDRQIQEICDEITSDPANYAVLGNGSYYDLNYAISILKADGTTKHYHLSDLVKYFDFFTNDITILARTTSTGYNLLYYDERRMQGYIDMFKQSIIEEGDRILAETNVGTIQPQLSLTIMDQYTGAVVGLVGGRGEKTASRTLNRATDTLRQAGSTFKVLAVYMPALDVAGYTLATPIDDSPYFYPGTTKEVKNWYKRNPPYMGLNPVRRAISYSMNILAVRTLETITPALGFSYLEKLGFTTLVKSKPAANGTTLSDIGLSLALGGLTDGVSNIELCAAYSAIANGGIYNKPYYYTAVYDHEGNLLLSHEVTQRQVMKPSTAFLLTSAMQDTIKSGLGSTTQPAFLEYRMPIAGKTGTTTASVDKWFVGFTPYYTCAVWAGFDNNYEVSNSQHQAIWRDIMETIHIKKALAYKEFEIPDSIVTAEVCTKSGKLAVPGLCDHADGGSTVKTEYFAKGTVPTEYCDMHIKVVVCADTFEFPNPECMTVVEKVLLKKTEPEVWIPTEIDPTTASPTPVPAWYIEPTPDPDVSATPTPVKQRLEYTTSDTKHLYPEQKCSIHGTPTPTPTPTPKEGIFNPGSQGGYIIPPTPTPTVTPLPTATPTPTGTPTPMPTPTPTPLPTPTPVPEGYIPLPEEMDAFIYIEGLGYIPIRDILGDDYVNQNEDEDMPDPDETENDTGQEAGNADAAPVPTPTPIPTPPPEDQQVVGSLRHYLPKKYKQYFFG